jgi:hypothetical protein
MGLEKEGLLFVNPMTYKKRGRYDRGQGAY